MGILDINQEELTKDKELLKFCKQFEKSFEVFKKEHGYADITLLDQVTLADLINEWLKSREYYQRRYEHIDIKYIHAASLMYWVTKTKPIYFQLGKAGPLHKEERYYTGRYNAVNEHFALCLGGAILGFDPVDMDEELRERFIYTLYYFNLAPEPLFFMLELLTNIFCNAKFVTDCQKLLDMAKQINTQTSL